jgi:hypothetical protein
METPFNKIKATVLMQQKKSKGLKKHFEKLHLPKGTAIPGHSNNYAQYTCRLRGRTVRGTPDDVYVHLATALRHVEDLHGVHDCALCDEKSLHGKYGEDEISLRERYSHTSVLSSIQLPILCSLFG